MNETGRGMNETTRKMLTAHIGRRDRGKLAKWRDHLRTDFAATGAETALWVKNQNPTQVTVTETPTGTTGNLHKRMQKQLLLPIPTSSF